MFLIDVCIDSYDYQIKLPIVQVSINWKSHIDTLNVDSL